MGVLSSPLLWDAALAATAAALAASPASGPRAVYTLTAAALHYAWGLPRLHMYPTSLTACATAVLALTAKATAASHEGVLSLALGAALALTALLEIALPSRPKLPAPTGPYGVAMFGTYVRRQERGVACIARVYYPVERGAAADAEVGAYLGHGLRTAAGYAAFMKTPTFLFSWLQGVVAPFVKGDPESLPLASPAGRHAAAGFPLVVFSHGLGGTPDAYTTLVADLVSRGNIVVTPEHTDGSAAYTALPDGREVHHAPLSPHQKAVLAEAYRYRHKQLRHRVREVRACIDEIAAYADGASSRGRGASEASPLAALLAAPGAVNMGAVFVAGHSFGGATALASAERESRVLGVLALDPWFFPLSPRTLARGLPRTPVLSVCGDGFAIWQENAVAWKLMLHAGTRLKHALGGGSGGDVLGAANPDATHVDAPKCGSGGDGGVSDGEIDDLALAYGASNGIDPHGKLHAAFSLTPGGAGNTPQAPHPGHLLLRLKKGMHQNFNDFCVTFQVLMQRIMKLTGAVDPVLGLRALADANAAFVEAVVAAEERAGQGSGARHAKGGARVPAFVSSDFVLPAGAATAVLEHEDKMPPVLS